MATKQITSVNPDATSNDEAEAKDPAAERKTSGASGRFRKTASARVFRKGARQVNNIRGW